MSRLDPNQYTAQRCVESDSNGNYYFYKRDQDGHNTAEQVARTVENSGGQPTGQPVNHDQFFPISQTAKRTGIGSHRAAHSQKATATGGTPTVISAASPWKTTTQANYSNPVDRKPKPVAMDNEGDYNPQFSVAVGMGYGTRHKNHRMYLTSHESV